jgi:hypothetical protein
LREFCDFDGLSAEGKAEYLKDRRGRFCQNKNAETGLPVGNDFNWAAFYFVNKEVV